MMTIKDYAKEQGVSYEAVRKQLSRYKNQLDEHIIKKGRQQFLDEYAVDFLTEKRNSQPVVVINQDQTNRINELETKLAVLEALLNQRNEDYLNLQKVAENRFLEASKVEFLENNIKSLESKAKKLELSLDSTKGVLKTRTEELNLLNAINIQRDKRIEQLEKELDHYQSMSLLQRIFNFKK